MEQKSKDIYRKSIDICKGHYENFPVGSFFVPRKYRRHVCAIYAFARTADDFADEDEFGPDENRLKCLGNWEKELLDCVRGESKNPVFSALSETIKEFNLPVAPFIDLITAFKMDVKKNRYENFDEVLYYCKHSANPVGNLMLRVFGEWSQEKEGFSDYICTALQLANFWQDVNVDIKKNRIYIPKEDFKRFNYNEEGLFCGKFNNEFRNLMGFEVGRTKELFLKGRRLCDIVGRGYKNELRLVWLGGMRILEKTASGNFDIFNHRPKLGVFDYMLMLVRLISWERQ